MILIYNLYMHEISKENKPKTGMIFIHLDEQNRLGEKTWSVSIMGDCTMENDSIQQGLFWDLENAVLFTESLQNKLSKKEK